MYRIFILTFLYIIIPGISHGQKDVKSSAWPTLLSQGDQVLFIGNGKVGSEGGLHHHFRRTVARADPPLMIQTEWPSMFGRPTLEDMYTEEVVENIETGKNNLVIVSSGSNEAMHRFQETIQNNGQKMVIYATWANNPMVDSGGWTGFRHKTEEILHNVQKFEKNTGIPVIPSGIIFYDLLVNPVEFEGLRKDYLFVPGSSVQNDLGTLVNVSAIYSVTTGRSPVGLWFWNPFPEKLVTQIQERVWRFVKEWKKGMVTLDRIDKKLTLATTTGEKNGHTVLWPPVLHNGERIFYVGNSFIGTEGGLENHFQRIIKRMDPPLFIEQSSKIFWGQGLSRMYTDEVVNEIKSGRNDLVVVTSGPLEILHKFHQTIRESGSKMMVHMTWGLNPAINKNGLDGFREQTVRIVENTRKFEQETGVPVAPCGLVFYDLTVDPPDIPDLRLDWLYMVENIHQNHIGTMANAATHYAVMTGRSPVGLPMWDPYPEKLVREVQERAWKIVENWKADKIEIKPVPESLKKAGSQLIPDGRRIDWDPGIPGGIPQIHGPVENVMDYGADPTGQADSHGAIKAAMDKLPPSGGIVYIPPGTYLLKSTLSVNNNNVVIRGAGMDSTKLISEANGISILVGPGTAGNWQKTGSGLQKGSLQVEVENGRMFEKNSFIEIQQENDSSIMYTRDTWIQGWAENSVGQVMEISSIDGNVIKLKTPLHLNFSDRLNPEARPVKMVSHIGIEDLYIEKRKPENHTVYFNHAAYCWMRNVESYMTKRSHVRTSASLGLEIRECYFHRSYDYGGGGHGYGVECSNHTADVLVENNVFDSLRHAMMVQTGANGNVFAYNYSAHPVQGTPGDSLNVGWVPPDISVHGHYPFMNLFEGNDVMEIGISDYWGPAGPGNTYLRNRVRGEGIFCYDHSHDQNLIGNRTTTLTNVDNTCLRMLKYGNIVNGMVPEDDQFHSRSSSIPASLYLKASPDFIKDHNWPPFGPETEKDNKLPAQKRYEKLIHPN